MMAMRPEQGALPTLYAATEPGVEGGSLLRPRGLMEARGYPKQVGSNKRSHDRADCRKTVGSIRGANRRALSVARQ